MKTLWQLAILLSLWLQHSVSAQSSYYRHEYYSPIGPSPTHYFRRSSGYPPSSYTHDLISGETKRKITAKKYSKPIPNRTSIFSDEDEFSVERFNSAELPNDSRGFNSQEQDSHEYTIGTQIRVQHPITVPKKITSSHSKTPKPKTNEQNYQQQYQHPHQSSSSKSHHFSYSSEEFGADSSAGPPSKKRPSKITHHYEPDPFHIIPPPKSTSPSIEASSSIGYNVYETEFEDFKPSKKTLERFKSVASEKQIEQFLEDQQKKLLDEALKLQLLNNPEFKQFLKAKEKKRLQREQRQLFNENDSIIAPPNPPPSVFLEHLEDGITFTTQRPRRRPADFKRSPKRKPGTIKPKRKFRSAIVIET